MFLLHTHYLLPTFRSQEKIWNGSSILDFVLLIEKVLMTGPGFTARQYKVRYMPRGRQQGGSKARAPRPGDDLIMSALTFPHVRG